MEIVILIAFWILVLIVKYIALSQSLHCERCRKKDKTIAELKKINAELLEHQAELCDTELKMYVIKRTLDRLYDIHDAPKRDFTPPEG